ncbi:MAG: hypothetical protein U0528_14055 [Anaerolineae bacterium]
MVHGTGDAVNTLTERVGMEPRTLPSPSGHVSRYTDAETLEIYTMAAAGQMNKMLVAKLQSLGVNALGLSGVDGKLMIARRKEAVRAIDPTTGKQRVVRDDYTGRQAGQRRSADSAIERGLRAGDRAAGVGLGPRTAERRWRSGGGAGRRARSRRIHW